MTIYLVQWSGPKGDDADSVSRRYACSSETKANTKHKEIFEASKPADSDIVIANRGEAITMHQPKTQSDVIDLINSLN